MKKEENCEILNRNSSREEKKIHLWRLETSLSYYMLLDDSDLNSKEINNLRVLWVKRREIRHWYLSIYHQMNLQKLVLQCVDAWRECDTSEECRWQLLLYCYVLTSWHIPSLVLYCTLWWYSLGPPRSAPEAAP